MYAARSLAPLPSSAKPTVPCNFTSDESNFHRRCVLVPASSSTVDSRSSRTFPSRFYGAREHNFESRDRCIPSKSRCFI